MMVKKILAGFITGVMMVSTTVNVFAAGSINSSEQKIIDELQAKNCPARYIAQAKNYVENEGVDITDEQAKKIIEHIDAAKSIVDAAGITTTSQLKQNTEVLNKVLDEAKAVADLLNLVIVFNQNNGEVNVYQKTKPYVDPSDIIGKTDAGTIKKTGGESTSINMVIFMLGLAVAGMAVVTKKNADVD